MKKRKVFFYVLLGMISLVVYAQKNSNEEIITQFYGWVRNVDEGSKPDAFIISFDDINGVFRLYPKKNYLYTALYISVYLEKEDIDKIVSILMKYIEWEEIATTNKVKIVKEIPNSNLELYFTEPFDSATFYFRFYSKKEDKHYLVMDSDKRGFMLNWLPLYLDISEVKSLIISLSDEEISYYLQKYEKNKKAQDLFQ